MGFHAVFKLMKNLLIVVVWFMQNNCIFIHSVYSNLNICPSTKMLLANCSSCHISCSSITLLYCLFLMYFFASSLYCILLFIFFHVADTPNFSYGDEMPLPHLLYFNITLELTLFLLYHNLCKLSIKI